MPIVMKYELGDILVNDKGTSRYKVLAVIGLVYILSYANNFEQTGDILTEDELKKQKIKKQDLPAAPPNKAPVFVRNDSNKPWECKVSMGIISNQGRLVCYGPKEGSKETLWDEWRRFEAT